VCRKNNQETINLALRSRGNDRKHTHIRMLPVILRIFSRFIARVSPKQSCTGENLKQECLQLPVFFKFGTQVRSEGKSIF
jgi:hypothetical protein